jgi:hypothetical protein
MSVRAQLLQLVARGCWANPSMGRQLHTSPALHDLREFFDWNSRAGKEPEAQGLHPRARQRSTNRLHQWISEGAQTGAPIFLARVRAGRAWHEQELRHKSWQDLQTLW